MTGVDVSRKIEERTHWRRWVTPEHIRNTPIHRWFVFPHSFTHDLVYALLDEWGLDKNCRILDPFVGAGTTLVAAKNREIPAIGYDLLPLAVFATNVKVRDYNLTKMMNVWQDLLKRLKEKPGNRNEAFPDLIKKAFPGLALDILAHIRREIYAMEDLKAREFFLLALLSILRDFSRAIPNGGWLRWSKRRIAWSQIIPAFQKKVEIMLNDVALFQTKHKTRVWKAILADSRGLAALDGPFDALITSPPYPNRHDYTRIFNLELLFAFIDNEEIKKLRYQTFESHVESRPFRNNGSAYREPSLLQQVLYGLETRPHDERIPSMLRGYFKDCYLNLVSSSRLMKSGSKMAYVVGNARYSGVMIPVDEILGQIGEQIGLKIDRIIAVRYRGNSAQQMGEYGREPSRESVVIFKC